MLSEILQINACLHSKMNSVEQRIIDQSLIAFYYSILCLWKLAHYCCSNCSVYWTEL